LLARKREMFCVCAFSKPRDWLWTLVGIARTMPSDRSITRRRWLRDSVIVTATTAALLILLELALRAFWPQHLRAEIFTPGRFAESDAKLGLRYVPGARGQFTHPEYRVEYAINADGFRDATEHPAEKAPGSTRVLVLGDSFTFGQGVNYEDSWPRIVERQLREAGRDDIGIVKAGFQGADTRSELILAKAVLDRYRPDVVVVAFLVNDLYTNTLDAVQREGHPATGGHDRAARDWEEVKRKVFIRNPQTADWQLLALARRMAITSATAYTRLYLAAEDRGGLFVNPPPPFIRGQLRTTAVLFDELAALCRSRGIPLIVFSLPQQFQVLYYTSAASRRDVDLSYYDVHFAQQAERRGYVWVPTLDVFAADYQKGEPLFHRLDGHFTPSGNRVAARGFIQRVVPLVARTRPAS
jgi:lysophospholipase L1-like esterase